MSPNTPYYNSAVEHAYPYDISKADQLLDRAGWTERDAAGYRSKNGVRLTVHFPVYATTQPADLALYEQLQATAKKAGFDLQIEKQDDAQVYNRQYSWDYDLYVDYWTVNTPGALKFIYHSDGLKSLDGGYHNNEAGINDPQLDHLLNEGPTESEPAKVKQIYDQAQQIVSDQALAAPLYVYPSLSAFNKDKVRGVHTDWTVHSVSLYDAWVPQ